MNRPSGSSTEKPIWLLTPAPYEEVTEEKVLQLYPPGRRHNIRQDAGIDLPCPKTINVHAGTVTTVNLGVKAVCLYGDPKNPQPEPTKQAPSGAGWLRWGYMLAPRSSIAKTSLSLANGVGIIDPGYLGPIKAQIRNHSSNKMYVLQEGSAIFQLISANLAPWDYEMIDSKDPRTRVFFDPNASQRGVGGFGSTGTSGSASEKE